MFDKTLYWINLGEGQQYLYLRKNEAGDQYKYTNWFKLVLGRRAVLAYIHHTIPGDCSDSEVLWKTIVADFTGPDIPATKSIAGYCCNPLLDCFLCDSRSLLRAVLCLIWPYMGPWGPPSVRHPFQPVATLQQLFQSWLYVNQQLATDGDAAQLKIETVV